MKQLTATLSHAQSLRAIGQYLEELGVDRFELDKAGSAYIVWISAEETPPKDSASPNLAIRFDRAKIRQLESAAQSRRGERDTPPDGRNLASSMRVLGHYLDRQAAGEFSLEWSKDRVRVDTGRKQRSFSIHQNLYDLGICMYLKRSGRNDLVARPSTAGAHTGPANRSLRVSPLPS